MKLNDLLSEACIVPHIDAKDKSDVLERLIKAAHKAGKVGNLYRFAEAIGARELIMSTGIGLGVAVPHAKMRELKDFFIVLGTLKTGIEWDSIDEQPVRLVFLIGGPDDDQTGYLHILSIIVHLAKNPARRQRLLEAVSPKEIIDYLGTL